MDINNIQFQGMEQIVEDWKSPFITDVFVIDKNQNCNAYYKGLYKERKLVDGNSFDLF